MHERTRRSREWTDEIIVEHAAEYGRFRVRELEWEFSRAEYDELRERFESDAAGGAGVWISRDDAVLCVRHEDEDAWSDPSGKREAGETFREAAHREVREEAGVTISVDGVIEIHAISHVAPERPPLVSPIVIFDGTYSGGEPGARDDDRVAEVRWFSERPEPLLYDALAEFPMPAAD